MKTQTRHKPDTNQIQTGDKQKLNRYNSLDILESQPVQIALVAHKGNELEKHSHVLHKQSRSKR